MESKKWYWLIYLKGRNGDPDVEKGLVDTVGEGKNGMNGESSIDIIHTIMCKIESWWEVAV